MVEAGKRDRGALCGLILNPAWGHAPLTLAYEQDVLVGDAESGSGWAFVKADFLSWSAEIVCGVPRVASLLVGLIGGHSPANWHGTQKGVRCPHISSKMDICGGYIFICRGGIKQMLHVARQHLLGSMLICTVWRS